MKQMLPISLAATLMLVASTAMAEDCFADYKAKKDNPLRLHYGVAQLYQECTPSSAKTEISGRIAKDGWTLLNVVSVFGADKLPGKESSAGKFYLRY